MAISDYINRVPTWGWAAGGVILIGLVFLMTKGSGGQSAISPAVPAADVNDILAQLQDAADQLGSNQPPAKTPTTPVPVNPIKTITGYVGQVTGRIRLYDKNRRYVRDVSGITLQFDQKIKIAGNWWYRIKSGKYRGMFVNPGRNIKITTLYSTVAPTTTQSTSTIPTSNNQVSS